MSTLRVFNDPFSLAPPRAVRENLAGGRFVLRHPEPLQPFARCIGAWLAHWAATTPQALFLAERASSAINRISESAEVIALYSNTPTPGPFGCSAYALPHRAPPGLAVQAGGGVARVQPALSCCSSLCSTW